MSVLESTDGELLHLADDFAEVGEDGWVALAAKVLNRSRAEDDQLDAAATRARLRTKLGGGLSTEALYLPAGDAAPLGYPGSMPFTRGSGPRSRAVPWGVRQLFDDPDAVATREAVTKDIARGVTSLWFEVGEGAVSAADLPALLDGVLFDLAPVVVSSWTDQLAAADALAAVWRASAEPAKARGCLGLDPIGLAAVSGTSADLSRFAEKAIALGAEFPSARPIVVDSRPYHDAGGSEVDEVACAIATGVAYLRALADAGVAPADAFKLIEFRFTVSADQFLSTASLRALRRLWARVGEALGVPEADRGAYEHAVTSWRMITRDDPWVNILRTTLACFGAAVGGAEVITTLPFDTACGLPDTLSRRIARNTQILLAEESHVAAVADPAGGSYYVETLTEQLAQAAWVWFQEIERVGGMAEALASGKVAERLAAARSELDALLAKRRRPLTGVSTFPQVDEEPLERKPRPPRPLSGGLPRRRDAEIFEALRDRTRTASAAGAPLTVFLATLGPQREFGGRQTFVANLLAVAGISTVTATQTEPTALAAEAAAASPYVILCSSARGYAEHGLAAIEALRAAGIKHVLVAGRAQELGEASGQVDGAVFDGMDVVTYLTDLLELLEAKK